MLKENERTFSTIQKITDVTVVLSSWAVAYILRFKMLANAEQGLSENFLKIGITLSVISYYFFSKYGLYNSQRFESRYNEILNTIKANTTSLAFLIISLYFIKFDHISRIHLGSYYLVSCFLLVSVRIIIRNILRKLRSNGKNLRHILLVGNSIQLEEYVKRTKSFKDSGISFKGWIDSDGLAKNNDILEIQLGLEEAKNI